MRMLPARTDCASRTNRANRARPTLVAVLLATAAAAAGCATTAPTLTTLTAPTPVDVVAPVVRVATEPSGPDGLETYDAETLLVRGLDLLQGEAWADAAGYFERLIREFPGDERANLAQYNRGVAYIHLGRGDEAVAAFDAYLTGLPTDASPKDVLDGRFKRGQALATARRYEEVVEVFDELAVEVVSPDDKIEALVDAGVGHYMLGLRPGGDQVHRPTAEYRFLEARRILKAESARRNMGHMQFFTAQAAFYLAELAHLDFLDYPLHWPSTADIEQQKATVSTTSLESLLGDQLEEKCQRLLRAQYQYLRAIREGHPGWAAASGYGVGRMYEELHAEMVALPAPDDLTADQQDIYRQLVRKKVLILLEKAEKTYAQTTDMVVRTGAAGVWAQKSRESLENIRKRILDESTAVARDEEAEAVVVPVADAGHGEKGKG
jgi:tetratricopeptide (TPR) repeat protein